MSRTNKRGKASDERPLTEKDHQYRTTKLVLLIGLGRTCIWAVLLAFIAWCTYLSVNVMSGKSTDFRAIIDWAVSFSVSKYVGWCVAAMMGIGWKVERSARKKAVKQADRAKLMEEMILPGRSSSGLDKEGENLRGDPI